MRWLAACACLALSFKTAQALELGTYQGSLADGTTLTLTVDQNPVSHMPRIAQATLSIPTVCPGLGTGGDFARIWSWAPNQDINNGVVDFQFNTGNDSKANFNLKAGKRWIWGPMRVVNAVLVPEPKGYRTEICPPRNDWHHIGLKLTGPGGSP